MLSQPARFRGLVGVVTALTALTAGGRAAGQDRPAATSHPAVVLIIRHGEKPPKDANSPELTAEGKERADALYRIFEKSPDRPDPFPKPDFIFAAKNVKKSHRPVLTATPLAERLKMPLNTDFHSDDTALARELLTNPKYAGKTVLVCWRHSAMPALATALGASGVPAEFPGASFDRVWEVRFDPQGKATFTDRPERLMPRDATK